MNARVPGRLPVPVVMLCAVCEPARVLIEVGLWLPKSELVASIDGFLDRKDSPEDSRGPCHPDTCPDSQCLYRCGRCGMVM
jgi:hypothetical protein